MHSVNYIRRRLSGHRAETFDVRENTRQAAVAVVLRERGEDETDVLFIKRAEKPGDPWSGHMAFPGGHLEPVDADLRAAAMRETHEEIGLDLGPAEYLGALDQQRAMPRGRPLNMLIAPHVFVIADEPEFILNHEVDEVVWADLRELISGTLHDWETRPMAGQPTAFNGYRLSERHFVWGLTYRMLKSFFSMLDQSWEPPPER